MRHLSLHATDLQFCPIEPLERYTEHIRKMSRLFDTGIVEDPIEIFHIYLT